MNLREVNVALAEAIRDVNAQTIDRAGLGRRLRELADRLAPTELALTAPPGGLSKASAIASVPKAHRDSYRRVWAYWVRATGKERAKETPERKRVVLARLRDGYSETDIKRAIDGCVNSEHHAEGGYTDLTLICRTGSKLEAFIERAGQRPQLADEDEAAENPEVTRLEEASMAALEVGNTAEYERLQEAAEKARGQRG